MVSGSVSTVSLKWPCMPMPPEVREGLRKWFREYAAWLSSDPMALRDYGKEQNHGLSYHVQLIAYARYCGDEAAARKNLEMMRSLVVKAVDKQGFLPAEVVRTRSWHYSAYALRMVMRAARFRIDVDGFSRQGVRQLLQRIRHEIPERSEERNYEFCDAGSCAPVPAD